MDRIDNFWLVRDFRSAVIQNPILKKRESAVRNAAVKWFIARRKKEDVILDVKIQNVISCPGRSHLIQSVRNAAVTCWKKGINYCVQMKIAVILRILRINRKLSLIF